MDKVRCPKCGTERPSGRACPKCLLELGLEPSVPRIEQVGPYRLLSRLGAGAMGEVYRAHDTRLNRDVAIKVLPEALANDPDRIARFRREARVAASLSHANIAAIYGFEEFDRAHFLVMELIEGQTLAQRLQAGALPMDEALHILAQIAEGLEAAHENGVIHRDLKPSNVKITPEGKAKILDFGLAKALDEEAPAKDIEASPTITAHLTEAGMVFGTVPYMSPEQARGRPVDKRSDIWALGCLIYECLAGRRAFAGETATDVLARILEREPDWSALPPRTPPQVRELLARCLEKDLKHRARDAGDVRIELERARAAREWSSTRSLRFGLPGKRMIRGAVPWGVAGLAIALFSILAARMYRSAGAGPMDPLPSGIPVRVDATDPDVLRAPGADISSLAISSDGSTLAYVGRATKSTWFDSAIYIRGADDPHVLQEINPLERGYGVSDPFFSPDGRWLGFSAGHLYKVSLSGGEPVLLTEGLSAAGTRGAVWTARGIVFSPAAKAGLVLVKEGGGALATLTVPDASKGEVSHRWPSALPDGRHILFTIKKEGITTFDEADIALLDLENGSWKTLLKGGSFARYVPTGHIVFARAGAILAAPFDAQKEEVTGPPVTVLSGVMTEPGSGAAQFAVAADAGTLLFAPGGPNIKRGEIVWIDRRGAVSSTGAPLEPYYRPYLSPDGARLASTVFGATDSVVVYDLNRHSSVRIPSEGNCLLVSWHPDGRELLFASDQDRSGQQKLFLAGADGSTKPRRLDIGVDAAAARLLARLPDGVGLIHRGSSGLLLSRLEEGAIPRPLSGVGEFDPGHPAVSPDGRWLAYDADVSGNREVYIRPFPVGNGLWQISRGGGSVCLWSPKSDELLYQQGEGAERALVSVRLTLSAQQITASSPVVLFKLPPDMEPGGINPDGMRIMVVRTVPPQFPGDRIQEIFNWFNQIQEKASAPPGR